MAKRAIESGAIALARSEAAWGLIACEAAMTLRNDGALESSWAALADAGLALYEAEAGCSDVAAA
jgi:hypothetical protein